MSRRELLTAVELAMAASALTAAVYGLVRAAYDPYAAVTWVPIAIVGVGTALAFVMLAAVLFVGRAALVLAGDALRVRRDGEAPPPSAMAPLWSQRPADGLFDAYASERAGGRRHAQPVTATVPVDALAQWGAHEYVGGGR